MNGDELGHNENECPAASRLGRGHHNHSLRLRLIRSPVSYSLISGGRPPRD